MIDFCFSYLLTINNPASETGNPRSIEIDPDWLGEMVRLVEKDQSDIVEYRLFGTICTEGALR